MSDPDLRSALLSWLRHAMLPRVAPSMAEAIHEDGTFDEVHDMLDIDPRHWWYKEVKEAWDKGAQEGQEAGKEAGQKQGQLALLASQLEGKFGPLSDSTQQRLQDATSEERSAWALKLLQANSLAEVFQ